jgi:DNA-binding NarL/FixJ family response regulator
MSLTERQHQIVALLMQGMSNKEIARNLGIAEGTVKQHMINIFQRSGVNKRAKLVATFMNTAR